MRIIRIYLGEGGADGAYRANLSRLQTNSICLCTILVQQSNYHAMSNWQGLIRGPRKAEVPSKVLRYGIIKIVDSAQYEISRASLAQKLLRVRACAMLDNGAVLYKITGTIL